MVSNVWRLHLYRDRSLLVLPLLPHLSEVWPSFTGVRGGDGYISGGLGWSGRGQRSCTPIPSFPQCCTYSGRLQCKPSARGKEIWRQRLPLTGAVPASLYTVQDLLLQFFPLLLLLGQSLSCWLWYVLAVVEDFAVLSVPQFSVQAAWVAEESVMVASLGHFTLAKKQRKEWTVN